MNLLCKSLIVISLGFATVFNLNYILAHFTFRVYDSFLRALDVSLYSYAFGALYTWYTKLFPIIRNDVVTYVLNNSYAVLFSEVMLALIVSCQCGVENVVWFLKNLFTLYFLGLLGFLLFPAIGPCLYFPEALDIARNPQLKYVSEMMHDYQVSVSSGGNLKGFGYFIALPSLHVLVGGTFLYSPRQPGAIQDVLASQHPNGLEYVLIGLPLHRRRCDFAYTWLSLDLV